MVTLENADEESSYIIHLEFWDEAPVPDLILPVTASWTLRNRTGGIVNGRTEVEITPLTTTVDIVLAGDDLDVNAYGAVRYFIVEATYNSTLGMGLPLREEATFRINRIP